MAIFLIHTSLLALEAILLAGAKNSRGGFHKLANQEADRIEADETLTDEEKRRYLRDLGEQLYETEQEVAYDPH